MFGTRSPVWTPAVYQADPKVPGHTHAWVEVIEGDESFDDAIYLHRVIRCSCGLSCDLGTIGRIILTGTVDD